MDGRCAPWQHGTKHIGDEPIAERAHLRAALLNDFSEQWWRSCAVLTTTEDMCNPGGPSLDDLDCNLLAHGQHIGNAADVGRDRLLAFLPCPVHDAHYFVGSIALGEQVSVASGGVCFDSVEGTGASAVRRAVLLFVGVHKEEREPLVANRYVGVLGDADLRAFPFRPSPETGWTGLVSFDESSDSVLED